MWVDCGFNYLCVFIVVWALVDCGFNYLYVFIVVWASVALSFGNVREVFVYIAVFLNIHDSDMP